MTWLAGVDGCPAGWLVALVRPVGEEVCLRVVAQATDIAALAEQPAIVAIDCPIGLPERAEAGGRGAEACVRPLLGERQSSVFSVPSRAAIYAADYGEACRIALASSDPPRKVSRQLFMLAGKIRELDGMLRSRPDFAVRAFEVHPELAFWRLNGERPLAQPKKVKSRPYGPGIALRRSLLVGEGIPGSIVDAAPPHGAGEDDVVDALACAAIARRLYRGVARPFPDPPPKDTFGLPMVIWA
jgi:predicted RNase H-like nuclease